jgi:hypothetical protein
MTAPAENIVARLRAGITITLGEEDCPDASVLDDAADEIERLEAVNAELLAALKAMIEPFATVTDETLRDYPDTPQPRNILAARAAIARAEGKDAP